MAERVPGFRRILIVKLSALGDVAHALPVIDFLRKAAPGAEVDWAVDRRFAPILEGNPGLRRVIPLDFSRWKREWRTAETRRAIAEAVRDLRAGGYDAAFDIQGNVKSGVVTRLSGAPVRWGFGGNGVREAPNLLFTNRKVPLLPEDRHITQKILRVAHAPFGGPFDLASLVSEIVTGEAENAVAAGIGRDLIPGAKPLVVLHPGTTWITKQMEPSFWAEVVRRLRDRLPAAGVLLSWGTEGERREAEEIREGAGGAVALLPRLTLKELAAVYRTCGYLMAPDTGPLHIAAAVGARTVSVFRATDGNRNAPRGAGHRFLQAPLPCTACLRKRCPRDAECRAGIPAGEVAEAMARLVRTGGGIPAERVLDAPRNGNSGDPAAIASSAAARPGIAPAGVSVVIPNYNGGNLLRENLPSVIRALERWGGEHEIIVVDDGSADDSCAFLGACFPRVILLKNPRNVGFSRSCNAGMAIARYPVTFCINNDVKVDDDFVAPMLRHFADGTVFAVTPRILAERDGKNQGIVEGRFVKGFIRGGFAAIGDRAGERENLYAIGACVAYDMEKFRALGGYAGIYSPYLFEDVDISYRAWKRGWRNLYEPGSTVHHESSATIGRARKRFRRKIHFRNRFLFHWINLTDPGFVLQNLLYTAMRLAVSFLWLDIAYYASFAGALRRLGEVRVRRRVEAQHRALRDRDVFRRTGTTV